MSAGGKQSGARSTSGATTTITRTVAADSRASRAEGAALVRTTMSANFMVCRVATAAVPDFFMLVFWRFPTLKSA